MKNKAFVIFLSIVMFFVGAIAGVGGLTYLTLPHNEELVETNSVYYSLSNKENTVAVADGVPEASEGAVSVHFLELGNKYTGDCTYIKVGENIDILIDCGSKSNSVATVSNYLNQYVTDGVLEYVIVTHAHQDHYAGFATSTKVDSIFDLFECETIITFSNTNQKTDPSYIEEGNTSIYGITSYASSSKSVSAMYRNFNRELTEELNSTLTKGSKAGQKPIHLTAKEVVEQYEEGEIILDSANDITLQILDSYYYKNKASSENDYSVCTMINQADKHFIFTGDLEIEGEDYLIQPSRNPVFYQTGFYVELYKAGHHGSKTSSGMDFLGVIKPKIVTVCCCAGSSEYTKTEANQFPTKEFINNISQFTTEVYVTTLCVNYDKGEYVSFNGNIVVTRDVGAERPSIYCSSDNKKSLMYSDWFKQNRLEICKQQEEGKQVLHPSWY